MIAIADSGSTKADWVFVKGNEWFPISTMGFNPFFHNSEKIKSELLKDFDGKIPIEKVDKVFYYGAGCSSKDRNEVVENGLKEVFTNASLIEVDHDLLGAARAACGDKPGVACIIGTGSNSCLYDGDQILDNVSNLGFLVGDEGSGSHLGKMLIRAYFYRELPSDIHTAFEARYPMGKQGILDKIYKDGPPNVFLASFAKFCSDHKSHIYMQKLVNDAFSEFVRRHVRKYENYNKLPINFVGSVAYHFQDILTMVLDERNMKMGIVIKKPIDNLVHFHVKKEKQLQA